MITNLHPLFVHFPRALLLSSVALNWADRRWPDKSMEPASWYMLLLGLAGTVFTLLSGLVAAQGVPIESPAAATLSIHRLLGIVTFALFGILAIWRWRSKGALSGNRRLAFTLMQVVGIALIATVGFYGGELVYTFGIGVANTGP